MIFKICCLGMAAAFTAFLLKSLGWRAAPVFSCLCLIFLHNELFQYLAEIINIYTDAALFSNGTEALLKIVGISYLFGISSDICRELGEGGIASALTLIGRLELIAVALPYISELISLALGLVS